MAPPLSLAPEPPVLWLTPAPAATAAAAAAVRAWVQATAPGAAMSDGGPHAPSMHTVAVTSVQWPFIATAASRHGANAALASPTPATIARFVDTGRFVAHGVNRVAAPPSDSGRRNDVDALVVSQLTRTLMHAWLGKDRCSAMAAAATAAFLPIMKLKAQGAAETYYVVTLPAVDAQRVLAAARTSLHDHVPAPFPSLRVAGAPTADVRAALARMATPTFRFTVGPEQQHPALVPVRLLTVQVAADAVFVNKGDFGCAVFEAAALVTASVAVPERGGGQQQQPRLRISVASSSTAEFAQVFRPGATRGGDYGLMWPLRVAGFDEAWYAVRNEVVGFNSSVAADMDVLPFTPPHVVDRTTLPRRGRGRGAGVGGRGAGSPASRSEASTVRRGGAGNDDKADDGEDDGGNLDRCLVRFGSAWARAALIAECRWRLEHVLHSTARAATAHLGRTHSLCRPDVALAVAEADLRRRRAVVDPAAPLQSRLATGGPVIAIDARETMMKDDAFQCFYDAATRHVVLRCMCATPLTPGTFTTDDDDSSDGGGILSSALMRAAFENVASVHDGKGKRDMIPGTRKHSLSLAHSRREPRAVVVVEARFDAADNLALVAARRGSGTSSGGDADEAVVELAEATIDAELSLGVTAQWRHETTGVFANALLDPAVPLRVADIERIAGETAATELTPPRVPGSLVDATMPAAVRRSLLLLRVVASRHADRSEELDVTPRNPYAPKPLHATARPDFMLTRLRVERSVVVVPGGSDGSGAPPRAVVHGEDFNFFPNRVFARHLNAAIRRRFKVGLYAQLPPGYPPHVTRAVWAFVADHTDSPALAATLRAGISQTDVDAVDGTAPDTTSVATKSPRLECTRQELRALVRSLPHAAPGLPFTTVAAALGLATGGDVPAVFVVDGATSEFPPSALTASRAVDLSAWAGEGEGDDADGRMRPLIECLQRPAAPATAPTERLNGTSGLRKFDHLLAQYLAVHPSPCSVDRTELVELLHESVAKLETAERRRRAEDGVNLLRFLCDPRVPASKRRGWPLLAVVTSADGSRVYVPALQLHVTGLPPLRRRPHTEENGSRPSPASSSSASASMACAAVTVLVSATAADTPQRSPGDTPEHIPGFLVCPASRDGEPAWRVQPVGGTTNNGAEGRPPPPPPRAAVVLTFEHTPIGSQGSLAAVPSALVPAWCRFATNEVT